VSLLLAAFAVLLCIVVDVTITADWVRTRFAFLRCTVPFVDSLSTVQVRRWFTSDNTFLRPIIISFVGAVAVLLPVPLTVCPSCRLLKPSLMFSPLTLCSCLSRQRQHFLAGQRRHGSKGFRIWQPFRGGSQFVVLQAMAWAIYSLSVIVVGYCLYLGVSKVRLIQHPCGQLSLVQAQ